MMQLRKILPFISFMTMVACAATETDESSTEQLASWPGPTEGLYVARQIEAVAPANSCDGLDLVFGDFQITRTGARTYVADESVGTSYGCTLAGKSANCGDAAEAYDIDYRPDGLDLYLVVTPHEGRTHQVWTSSTTFQHRFGGRITCDGAMCDEFFAPSLDESGCNLSTIAFFELAP